MKRAFEHPQTWTSPWEPGKWLPSHAGRHLLPLLAVALLALATAACEREDEAHEADHADGAPVELDLQQAVVDLETQEDGDRRYVVVVSDGREQRLTAEQFVAALDASQQRQRERGWVFVVLNITSWAGVLWVALGLAGQFAFTGRMVVQWLTSERAGRSVVPPLFWWLSLIGASMLLTYFIWRKDIVGVLGQGTGWVIYARNLWMIYRPTTTGFAAPAQA